MLTDAELLRRYTAEKSEAAFTELVRRHLDLVYSAALRQVGGDAHRAQDVAQVVFTTLARKASALTRHPVLVGWLYTATQHAAAKAIRTETRRRAREQEAHLMEKIVGPDTAPIDAAELRGVLDAAMHELPEVDREAVLLRYFAQRPFREIGEALRISEDAARMRVERALGKLREVLARRGATSTVATLALALTQQAAIAAPAGLATHISGAALASVATGAFDLLAFMSTTKFIGVSTAAVVLLAIGVAVREVRSERLADAALAESRQSHAAMTERLRAAAQRAEAARNEADGLQRELDAARTAQATTATPNAATKTSASSPATHDAATAADPVVAGRELMARFPAVKDALLQRSLARIRGRYEPLYAQLGLTPEQVQRFETILLDSEGLTSTSAGIGTVQLTVGEGRTRDEVIRALRELLGEDGMRAYREMSDRSARQQFTIELATSLYFTDEPLTAQQAERVAAVVARFPIKPEDGVLRRDWDGLLAEARSALSEGQLAALGRIRAQEEFGATMKFRTTRP